MADSLWDVQKAADEEEAKQAAQAAATLPPPPAAQPPPTGNPIANPMAALIGGAGGTAAAPIMPLYQDLPSFSKEQMNAAIPAGFPSTGGTLQGLYDEANKTGNFDKVKDLLGKIDLAKSASQVPEPIRPGDQFPLGANYTPEQMASYVRQMHAGQDERLAQSFAQGEKETGTKNVRDLNYFLNGRIASDQNVEAARGQQGAAASQQAAEQLRKMAIGTELQKQELINKNALEMHKLQMDVLNKKQEEEDANTHSRASNAVFQSELSKAQANPDPAISSNALKIASQAQSVFNEKAGRDAQGKKVEPPSGKAQTPAGEFGPEAKKAQAISDVSNIAPKTPGGEINVDALASLMQSAKYRDDPEAKKLLADQIRNLPDAQKHMARVGFEAAAHQTNIGRPFSLFGEGAAEWERKGAALKDIAEELFSKK